nr:DUF262 domain-containing protein [uncultured Actinomyces sp.]
MSEPQALSSSQSYSIAQLRSLVKAGRLRVPQFQRSFRWEKQDVLNLIDSVLRGYPIGSLLLWKREAGAGHLRIGALDVDAGSLPEALWVVDGQQRITSLVNVVDPEGARDSRFSLGYSLGEQKVIPLRDSGSSLIIPLPDLFDLGRALAWLRDNPDGADFAVHIQDIAGRLADVSVPATIMEDADEMVLREVFDRINNRGKKLNAAEIFDAIHGGPSKGLTTAGIAAHVDEQTHFGALPDKVVVQALLVRRHTDITRDVHGEFSPRRRAVSDFSNENQEEAYAATERALAAAVVFLQQQCGVPHMTFLPFRFQLLVLTRFFAFFPHAQDRNLELLRRWFWRTSVGADELGINGSQTDLRDMAACLVPRQESASVQRLLSAATLVSAPKIPDLGVFRATRSDSKVILTAMWNLEPIDPDSGAPITTETLDAQLESETTPRGVVSDLVPASLLPDGAPVAANKVISTKDRRDLLSLLDSEFELASLLLDEQILHDLQENRYEDVIEARTELLRSYLGDFIRARTAYGHEDTPPLGDYFTDEDWQKSEAS